MLSEESGQKEKRVSIWQVDYKFLPIPHFSLNLCFCNELCCFSHQELESIPSPLNLGILCDLFWPTECGRGNSVTVPETGLKKSYRASILSLGLLLSPWENAWASLMDNERWWLAKLRKYMTNWHEVYPKPGNKVRTSLRESPTWPLANRKWAQMRLEETSRLSTGS